jgi:hypothetical protein
MNITSLDEKQLKELFKQAMTELFEERKDLFYDVIVEVIEEASLVNAIRAGEASEPISREAVFRILDGQA